MCFHPHEWSLCLSYFVKTQTNRFPTWKFFMWQLSEMYYNSKISTATEKRSFSSISFFMFFFPLLLCHAARACTTGLEFSDYTIDILKAEFHLHSYSLWYKLMELPYLLSYKLRRYISSISHLSLKIPSFFASADVRNLPGKSLYNTRLFSFSTFMIG